MKKSEIKERKSISIELIDKKGKMNNVQFMYRGEINFEGAWWKMYINLDTNAEVSEAFQNKKTDEIRIKRRETYRFNN